MRDLPSARETALVLRRALTGLFGLPEERAADWSNGSAPEFLEWLERQREKGGPDGVLLLYLSTHQLRDGSLRFANGPDLKPGNLAAALRGLASRWKQVVWIHDACHAAVLEEHGPFPSNLIRWYATPAEELAEDLRFSKGPYGLEAFARPGRGFLRSSLNLDPPGMSLLGVLGLAAGMELREKAPRTVTLRMLAGAMEEARRDYSRRVRQARAPHPVLLPEDADPPILERVE